MLCVGIDPGLDGAVAVIDDRRAGREDGRVRTWDIPTLTVASAGGHRREYQLPAMVDILRSFVPCLGRDVRAALELVHSSPQQGVRSAFSMGVGVGVWEGLLAALGIPYERVPPQRWKRVMLDGMGHDKDAARLRVGQLFPDVDVRLKKHHGRADAVLIAEWLRRTVVGPSLSAEAVEAAPF